MRRTGAELSAKLRDASRVLQDAAKYIEAQGTIAGALRIGGRTPGKAIDTIQRLGGERAFRYRMARIWIALDAEAVETDPQSVVIEDFGLAAALLSSGLIDRLSLYASHMPNMQITESRVELAASWAEAIMKEIKREP